MKKIFGNYARYYDLLYRDKDYAGEARFVHQLLQTHAPSTKTILDLGCGTGAHAALLAKEGYQEIHGVDLSTDMLLRAKDRLSQISPESALKLQFSQGDIRTIRLDQQFDAVISLFHVISYQTTNEDLQAAFATVKAHLKPGGVFIFDCWYGPAVLTERPAVRVKRLEDREIMVTRIAEPVMLPNDNLVDVNYQVFIKDKNSDAVDEIRENHRMRYWFRPEIENFLINSHLKLITCREWMTNRELGFETWGVYFVGRLNK